MPSFHDQAVSPAAPEEVWKLLFDPARFPEWWAGIGSVQVTGAKQFTMYPEGYPDFPMPQQLQTRPESGRIAISCLVSDLRFEWRLAPEGAGTRISVDVEIPEAEAHRLDTQRDVISRSLQRLAQIAGAHGQPVHG